MESSTKNIVYGLPHELRNGLRLRIIGNSKIMGKTLVVRNYKSTDIKVSRLVQFFFIF